MNSDRTTKTNPKHEVAWLVRTGLLAGSLTLASLLLALGSVRFIRIGAEVAHTNLDAIVKVATDYVFQNHYDSEMALSLNSMEPANEEHLLTLLETLEGRWKLASEADPLVEQEYETFSELLLSCQLIFEIKKESDEWQQTYVQYRGKFRDNHKAASKMVSELHNLNLAAIGSLRLAEASLLQASNAELEASRVALKANIGEQMRLYRIRTDLDNLLLHVEKLASSNTVNLLPDLRENKIHPVLSSLELSFAEEPESLAIVHQLAKTLFQERNSGDSMEANAEKGLYDYRRDLICLERQQESINNRTRDLMESVRKQGVALQQLSTRIDDVANQRSEVAILVVIGVVSVVSAVSCLAFVLLARSVGNSIHEQLEALNGSNRDLKGTYEQLQKLQGQNSSFLQTTADVVLTVDSKGRVITANAATHEILGVMPEELIGRSIFLYVPSLSNASAELSRDEAFAIRREVEVTHESGKAFPAEIVVSLLGWEEDSLFAILLTDASRRKYAEQQAVTLGKLVEDAVNESIVFRANDSKILFANRRFQDQVQFETEELHAKSIDLLLADCSPATIRNWLEPIYEESMEEVAAEGHFVRKDGSTYPVFLTLRRIRWNHQDAFVAFAIDQTDLHRTQTELVQAKKLESVGQLAAGIAHEINSPLQYVSDNTEYLAQVSKELFRLFDLYQSALACDDPAERAQAQMDVARLRQSIRFEKLTHAIPDAIEDMRDGVERVVEIVRAMRIFSHPGGNEKSVTDLNSAIQSTVIITKNRWRDVVEMEIDFDPNLPQLRVYSQELNQVFSNLILNATDAIQERMQNDKDFKRGLIRIQTRYENNEASIQISDNGCGIPATIIERVFEPFFTTKEIGKGTGQGLAIVKNIITNRHGGRISIQSHVNQGTTFRFSIPREQAKALIDSARMESRMSVQKSSSDRNPPFPIQSEHFDYDHLEFGNPSFF